ncbi:MAG: DNA methyltransferase [Anaerolineaceae bacterium]|nr:DNA methyltransferase [Anaerolineaceae bacterium]MCY3907389.1 DNA methyltransferase [Anaerolineaceae bacterium]
MRAPAHADEQSVRKRDSEYLGRLTALLQSELDFHNLPTGDATHSFHAFPAKFPPQLARLFVDELTAPSEVVLDPMMGSGTTIIEAFLAERQAKGFDIDPLACLQSRVKTSPLHPTETLQQGFAVLNRAKKLLTRDSKGLEQRLAARFGDKTRDFVDYWFAKETQIELQALLEEIENVPCEETRSFLLLVFSAIIITKSGGVSYALDLAHTRPHRAKLVYGPSGKILFDEMSDTISNHRARFLTKKLRSPVDEFQRRLEQNVQGLRDLPKSHQKPIVKEADAQALPLEDNCIDLIVTSPPYASNAIDYMRSHKFALAWMGHAIESLSMLRSTYIGSDATAGFTFEDLPPNTRQTVSRLAGLDARKSTVLHRYYSEMTRVLKEMFRILRPGKAAILVVGSSVMRGMDTRTQYCLSDIGRSLGFEVPPFGVRRLDRNRRMMPVSSRRDANSPIQQRMHEEYVIGFCKPETGERSNDAG